MTDDPSPKNTINRKSTVVAAVVLTQGVLLTGCLNADDLFAIADFAEAVNGTGSGGGYIGGGECCRPGGNVAV